MDNLYARIQKLATPKWVGIFAVLFVIATALNVGKPFGIAQLNEMTGDAGVLDEMSYSSEEAHAVLTAQGEAGRAFYRQLLLSTELFFPAIYRTFNVLFITFLLGRWFSQENRWRYVCLLPWVGMMADYVENMLVVRMLGVYPKQTPIVATIASAVTKLKWGSNYLDWTLMVIGLAGVLVWTITKRRKEVAL